MSFGGGKSNQITEPVTWEELMTPQQQFGQMVMAPGLIQEGVRGIGGHGLSPDERTRQKTMLAGDIGDYAAGMKRSVEGRAADLGQRGGVVSGMGGNIDAAKIFAFGEGLRSIEDMNQQLAQQKTANLLSFVTWNPPVSQRSEGSSSNYSASLG